jgi:PD-(D/E)XK nuclease superfamily
MPMSSTPPIRNLSVSKIEKAMLCPKHYKLKFLDRIPEPSSWVAHGGIVVHEIVEWALKAYGQTLSYPSWQEMDDRYLPTWERKRVETESKDSFLCWKEEPEEPSEKVRDECRALLRVAADQALPLFSPWILDDEGPVVEKRIDLELESRIGPFPIIGYIDLLDASGTIVDWKTTTVNKEGKVSERKMKSWLQNAAYSIWGWPIIGEEVVPCKKVFLVRGPEPRLEISSFSVGPMHRKFFTDVAAEVWQMTVRGGFPANTNTWMCNPKYCAFYGPCKGEIDDDAVHGSGAEAAF